MRTILTLILLLICMSLDAATLTPSAFNTNQFVTGGTPIVPVISANTSPSNPSALVTQSQLDSITTNSSGAGFVFQWTEPTVYYVSPTLGSDSNSGRNRSAPLLSYTNAADLAYSNAPATIVLMAGAHNFPGTHGDFRDFFIIPPFVNVVGEPGNQVIITCTNTSGTFGYPDMQPDGTNNIKDINFTFVSPISSDVPLGNAGQFLPLNYQNVPWPGSGTPTNIFGVYFSQCTFNFQGTGIHFENLGASTSYQWDFKDCTFLCNNNFVQMREGGPLITVENSDVTLLNWTNVTVINAKPFRMFESRTAPNVFSNNFPVRIANTQFHVNDSDLSNSNRPFYFVYNTQNLTNNFVATNIFAMSACRIDETITNPTSIDIQPMAFNTSTQCVLQVNNVFRVDTGGPLTVTPGFTLRTFQETGPQQSLYGRVSYRTNAYTLQEITATNCFGLWISNDGTYTNFYLTIGSNNAGTEVLVNKHLVFQP